MNLPEPIFGSNSGALIVLPPKGSYIPPTDQRAHQAALVIQKAYRGHAARKKFVHNSVNCFLKDFNLETKTLSRNIIQTADRAYESWKSLIIGKGRQNDAMDDVEKMRDQFQRMDVELNYKQYFSFPKNRTDVKEFRDIFWKKLGACQDRLKKVSSQIGFWDIENGLSIILGNSWKLQFSQEALEFISAYNLLFTPTAYILCLVKNDPGEAVGKLIDMNGNEEAQGIWTVKKGIPFFRDFRFFKQISGMDYIHGAEINIPYRLPDGEYRVIVMKGYFKNDPANTAQLIETVYRMRRVIEREFETVGSVSKEFKAAYLNQYSLKDLVIKTPAQAKEEMEADWNFVSNSKNRIIPSLISTFKEASFERQLRIFSLLAIYDASKALFLYEMLLKQVPFYVETIRNTMHYSLFRKLNIAIEEFEETKEKLKAAKEDKVPYETRIAMSKMDFSAKQKAFEKLKSLKSNSSESEKAEKYLNGLLKVPFGIYTTLPVNHQSSPEDKQKFLQKVAKDLNDSVHGHEKAKEAFLEWIAQRISNNSSKGECLALEGPPGNGKTTFAKYGIANALGRPFFYISMGGQSDGAILIGHGFTYVGSNWGRIVEILREAQCMDPVIYIDEIDKISQTEKGQELINALTDITDFTKNDQFHDNYFSGINFDLSRSLFVFSYNDRSKLNRVFLDRLKVIKTEALSQSDKLAITHKHLFPEILDSCGFKENEVIILDPEVKFIIDNYTMEAGARKLKENLFSIVRGLNKKRILEPESVGLPYQIDKQTVIRFREEPKIEYAKILNRPMVGMVNGLFATDMGIGGLLHIQVDKAPANERMALTLTGSLQDVIKESMIVARSVAWNLVSAEIREKIMKEAPQGLHIHAPEGATPKDGPSAGGAITTALISQLTGIPVRNEVAMTGEIDLIGRITKIGGLPAKLQGAKRAGAKLALVPKENEKDLIKIKEKFPELIDDQFKVILVDNIHDVLDHALVQNPIPRRPGFAAYGLTPPSETIKGT